MGSKFHFLHGSIESVKNSLKTITRTTLYVDFLGKTKDFIKETLANSILSTEFDPKFQNIISPLLKRVGWTSAAWTVSRIKVPIVF